MDAKFKKICDKIVEMRNNAEANARKLDDNWQFEEARNEISKAVALLELLAEVEKIIND